MESLRTGDTDPALTYTLSDFVAMKDIDTSTYRNFSILEKYDDIEFVDHNLIDDYIDILEELCVQCELSDEEYLKYKYAPDMLAYDVYGSTQLDFLILAANGIIDPKDFDMTTVNLPKVAVAKEFLTEILTANTPYIEDNRQNFGIIN